MNDYIQPTSEEIHGIEHYEYRYSAEWHDDRISEIITERESVGINLSEQQPAISRVFHQGIESILEGTPSMLFIALLQTLAESGSDELDNALRAAAKSENIKLANRNIKREKIKNHNREVTRHAWVNRFDHPEHGHRFRNTKPEKHLSLFSQFIMTEQDLRTIKSYLQATPSLITMRPRKTATE